MHTIDGGCVAVELVGSALALLPWFLCWQVLFLLVGALSLSQGLGLCLCGSLCAALALRLDAWCAPPLPSCVEVLHLDTTHWWLRFN